MRHIICSNNLWVLDTEQWTKLKTLTKEQNIPVLTDLIFYWEEMNIKRICKIYGVLDDKSAMEKNKGLNGVREYNENRF